MLSQNIFVRTLQLFAECMGHNFVIKALFLCTMHWYFCNQISFLSKSGLLCHWKSNKNDLIVSRDHASNADVFVFIVFMSIKMSESSVARAVAGQIGTKYGARGAAKMIDRWCDGLNWSGMELFPIWRQTFAPESVRVRHKSLKCFHGRQHQQKKSGERFSF